MDEGFNWRPGRSVSPSIDDGIRQLVNKQFSAEIQAAQGTNTGGLNHDSFAKILPDHNIPDEEKEDLNSGELQSLIVNDVLGLKEDYPLRGSPLGSYEYKVFCEEAGKSVHPGASIMDNINHRGEEHKDIVMADTKKKTQLDKKVAGDLQSLKKTMDTMLKEYFALKGKDFQPFVQQGNIGSLNNFNIPQVKLSELMQASKDRGCTNEIFLFYDSSNKTNETPRLSNPQEMVGFLGPRKLAEPHGLDKPAFNSQSRGRPPPPHKTLSIDKSVKKIAPTYVAREMFFPSQPEMSTPPEPPDMDHYTCSDELKKAVQLKFLPFQKNDTNRAEPNFQPNSTAYGQRYHPYNRQETANNRQETASAVNYQTTLPYLDIFENNCKQ